MNHEFWCKNYFGDALSLARRNF